MKITVTEHGRIIVVSVDSSVLQEHVPQFRERLNDLIEKKYYWIVFDMKEANYISSMGISAILAVKRKVNDAGGDVLFAHVNHLIMNLFEVTELIRKLEIFTDVDDAVHELENRIP
jgi:anti-sigma B factor antagonist